MANDFPENAKVNSTLGILRILYNNNGKLSIGDLEELSKSHVDSFLPQVNAAKLLGLIKVSGTNVELTRLGKSFHMSDEKAKEKIRDELKKFEPFKTLSACTGDGITIEELGTKLLEKGIYWNTEDRENIDTMHNMLIQWAIYFGIASYDGTNKRWKSESRG